MTSKKRWSKLSKKFLDDHAVIGSETIFQINNFDFYALPGVFSPSISSDTKWFANYLLPLVKGKKILEIGAGTGAIACLAKLHGAKEVCATDINPLAVDNIRANARLHNLKIDIFEADIFDSLPIKTKFDIIFWNHPFNYTEEKKDIDSLLSLSVFDLRYNSLRKYIRDSKKWINKNGVLLLGTGNIARIRLIRAISSDLGYKMLLNKKTNVGLSATNKTTMDIRLYSFINQRSKKYS